MASNVIIPCSLRRFSSPQGLLTRPPTQPGNRAPLKPDYRTVPMS